MILCQSHSSQHALTDWLEHEKPDAIFAVTDSNTFTVFQNHFFNLIPSDHVVIIPRGEQHKNLGSAEMIWDMLVNEGATRKSVIINFGGGLVTDLGGFAASTFMRGIRFIHIPTTLLAMVDAAEGGKTGINYGQYKNYIGTFTPASEVIVDSQWLQFLPADELVNGWAEVIKHAIISGDPLWSLIQVGLPEIGNHTEWMEIIAQNIRVKSAIVALDPLEGGMRKSLNLGHTVAHALEAFFLHNADYISHGQAVAAGMIIEAQIALEKKILPQSQFEAITNCIQTTFPKTQLYSDQFDSLISYMKADKKNHSGHILMALPQNIGDVVWDIQVSKVEIERALKQYVIG